MIDLYIYAYPMQMITFQTVTSDGEIVTNESHAFEDVIKITSKYLSGINPIHNIYIVGETSYADKIEFMVSNAFKHKVNIERIRNA